MAGDCILLRIAALSRFIHRDIRFDLRGALLSQNPIEKNGSLSAGPAKTNTAQSQKPAPKEQ
jgi:hypothetical protein